LARGCCPKKWSEETHESNDCGFFPFRPEDLGIEFGAGEKRENNGARTGEKADPTRLPAKFGMHEKRPNYQLGHGANNNFTQGSGDPEPDGNQRRDQGQADPHSGENPNVLHATPPLSVLRIVAGTMTPRQKIRLSGVISCFRLKDETEVDGELLHPFATSLVRQKTDIEVNGSHHSLRT
jgi:hypothetical protein